MFVRFLSQIKIPENRRVIRYESESVKPWSIAKRVYELKLSEWKLLFYLVDIEEKLIYYPFSFPAEIVEKAREKADRRWAEVERWCIESGVCKIEGGVIEMPHWIGLLLESAVNLEICYFCRDVLKVYDYCDSVSFRLRVRKPFVYVIVDNEIEDEIHEMVFVKINEAREVIEQVYGSVERAIELEKLKFKALFGDEDLTREEVELFKEAENLDYELIRRIAKPRIDLSKRVYVSELAEKLGLVTYA